MTPSVRAVGERQVAGLEPRTLGRPGWLWPAAGRHSTRLSRPAIRLILQPGPGDGPALPRGQQHLGSHLQQAKHSGTHGLTCHPSKTILTTYKIDAHPCRPSFVRLRLMVARQRSAGLRHCRPSLRRFVDAPGYGAHQTPGGSAMAADQAGRDQEYELALAASLVPGMAVSAAEADDDHDLAISVSDSRLALAYLLSRASDDYIAVMDVLEASVTDMTCIGSGGPSALATRPRPPTWSSAAAARRGPCGWPGPPCRSARPGPEHRPPARPQIR